MAQPGRAYTDVEALSLPACDFAIDQQTKPFGVAEISGTILSLNIREVFGHAVQSHGFQMIEGWVREHDVSFQWK